jgi:hypothetical protein
MAFQVLHQVVVEAVALQELEGIVPRAGGLELEAVQVFILLQYPDACIGDKGHAYST